MDTATGGTMVLVPTYMEVGTICRLIDGIGNVLPDARVLVVDDQSPDGTAEAVRRRYGSESHVRVETRSGPRGFGYAMRDGLALFLASDAERVITIDADLSHDPALAARMSERVDARGIVIGSRYLHGARSSDWASGRMRVSIMGNHYVRAIMRLPVHDCTSGFRCYSRYAVQQLPLTQLTSRGYAFQVETLYWIWRAGCPIAEIPIIYRDRLVGESKLNAHIVLEALIAPWRLRRRGRRKTTAKVTRSEIPSAGNAG